MSRLGFEHLTFRLRGERSNPQRRRREMLRNNSIKWSTWRLVTFRGRWAGKVQPMELVGHQNLRTVFVNT